jgi:hypothetical protein
MPGWMERDNGPSNVGFFSKRKALDIGILADPDLKE